MVSASKSLLLGLLGRRVAFLGPDLVASIGQTPELTRTSVRTRDDIDR